MLRDVRAKKEAAERPPPPPMRAFTYVPVANGAAVHSLILVAVCLSLSYHYRFVFELKEKLGSTELQVLSAAEKLGNIESKLATTVEEGQKLDQGLRRVAHSVNDQNNATELNLNQKWETELERLLKVLQAMAKKKQEMAGVGRVLTLVRLMTAAKIIHPEGPTVTSGVLYRWREATIIGTRIDAINVVR